MEKKEIKILTIDDNSDRLAGLTKLIRDSFPRAVALVASGGREGLDLAIREDPDVILLNILLKGMDGFEVCKKLKADKKHCETPVILLSEAGGDKQNSKRALECGADSFLSKPPDETDLIILIRAMVKIKAYNRIKAVNKRGLKDSVSEQNYLLKKELEERTKAQQELLKSKHQYDSLVAKIPVGIYMLHSTLEGSFALDYVSPRMAEIFNTDVKSMLSDKQAVISSIHPDELDGFVRLNNEGIAQNRPFDWKGRVLIGGAVKWLHLVSTPEMQESGDVFWHGLVVDITERVIAEEALLESNELFSLFMKFTPVYAFIKEVSESQSRVIRASENYIDMIGIPGSQMEGKTMEELFPAEFAAKFTADDWDVVSKARVLKLDEDLNGRNYNTIKFPIFQRGRNLLAGFTIDITERKQAENLIKEKVMELERFNNLMVGRELKMVELKQEINELCIRLGEKEKYIIAK